MPGKKGKLAGEKEKNTGKKGGSDVPQEGVQMRKRWREAKVGKERGIPGGGEKSTRKKAPYPRRDKKKNSLTGEGEQSFQLSKRRKFPEGGAGKGVGDLLGGESAGFQRTTGALSFPSIGKQEGARSEKKVERGEKLHIRRSDQK